VGFGDEIIASGLARGARERGKRIAFGDGHAIQWGPWCREIFKGNPNIAPPGSEWAKDLEWIAHYKGHRLYNKASNGRWVWNYEFHPVPGEFFFDDIEKYVASKYARGFVVVEPNVPWHKSVAANKDWGDGKYEQVAQVLMDAGFHVVQFKHRNSRRLIKGAQIVELPKFRHVIAVLQRAALYIGPEGGMHHAAAAVGIKAVVIFGGFIPPEVTGYSGHINLTGGAKACGNITSCLHCRNAMAAIDVDDVIGQAVLQLP
jgi:Glycosyltransferase family 9 (heptosyltransferase)